MYKYAFFLIIIGLCCPSSSFGRDLIGFISEHHTYTVHDLENYTTVSEIEGINLGQTNGQIAISISELAELINIELYVWNGKKWKTSNIKNTERVSTMNWSSFFNGVKNYWYTIPPGIHFKINLTTQSRHSLFLTKMHHDGIYGSVNATYEFNLPEDLTLTTHTQNHYAGHITFETKDLDSTRSSPYLIHPKNSIPSEYFSQWFQERTTELFNLTSASLPEDLKKIDTERVNRDSLAASCFYAVQNAIRYVDIENGIHSIIPRECNETYKNKLGDCKDMATLLVALYRYFGFDSYLAISRTSILDDPFDFPSIGLANHMICVLEHNNTTYFLDPTENECLFGDPSLQILDTEAFILKDTTDHFLSVPANPTSKSEVEITYTIDRLSKNITMQVETKGKMNLSLYYLDKKGGNEKILEVIQKITQMDWVLVDGKTDRSHSTTLFSAPISSAMQSQVGKINFYNLTPVLISPIDMTYLFHSKNQPRYSSNVIINVILSGKIQNIQPSTETINIVSKTDSTIHLDYQLSPITNDSIPFEKTQLIHDWDQLFFKSISILHED